MIYLCRRLLVPPFFPKKLRTLLNKLFLDFEALGAGDNAEIVMLLVTFGRERDSCMTSSALALTFALALAKCFRAFSTARKGNK
jgi:hypothetical protein